jgi:type I restriction enzyme, S subunit
MSWPIATLGDCGEIQGGLQVTSKRQSLPLSRPYLRVANVHRGRLDLTEIKEIRATPAEVDRTRLQSGDLLFVEGHANPQEVGRVAVWDGSIPECVHQNHLIRVRLDPSVLLPGFAVAWFNSPAGASHFRRAGKTTSGLNTISANTVRSAPTLLPPLGEQIRIAAILDSAAALLTKRRRVIAQLIRLKCAFFANMIGSPLTNPKGWPLRRIDELGLVTTGRTPPSSNPRSFGGSIPFVTPGDLESGNPAVRTLTRDGAQGSRLVRAGATLVCCIGATIGKVGIATVQSGFNQQINGVEWTDAIQDEIGYWTMRMMKPRIASLGSATTMPLLPKSRFAEIQMPVPPADVQRIFTDHVAVVDKQLARAEQAACLAEAALASLQSRAFSGQL